MKTFHLKFICLLFLLGSCATQKSQSVTMEGYYQVQDGKTREDVLKEFGEPVSITVNDDGVEVFTYIERFSLDERVLQARYYYFYFRDGRLIGKSVKVEDRPLEINSDQV